MFLVILLLTASGERVRVMGSTSAKTGLYPARRIASVVEGKVKGVVITSFFSESRQRSSLRSLPGPGGSASRGFSASCCSFSPSLMPRSARYRAMSPLETGWQQGMPVYSNSIWRKVSSQGPKFVYCPEESTRITASAYSARYD